MSNSLNFSDLSCELTKLISKDDKKKDGIFFTPPSIITKNVDIINNIPNFKYETVLEPSCGSCEFINYIDTHYTNKQIQGIEFNTTIFTNINKLTFNNNVNIINDDYLQYDDIASNKYDLIIGNPPYYVMKKNEVDIKYWNYFEGRPNIFILFIIHSLTKLNQNGVLSFILPSSFTNCLYYNKLREHIANNYKIIDIVACDEDDYLETTQNTIIFIIQNTNDNLSNSDYILLKNNYTIFNTKENIIKINELYNESSTLHSLNCKVSVGSVVWNQCKDILTDDSSDTLLIYSSDIKKNKLQIQTYTNDKKKNYIKKEGTNNPLLVINRGYGKGSYKFEYCLLDIKQKYLIENHLICIQHNGSNKTDIIAMYKRIIQSFSDDRTAQFIETYFGNSAINTTELTHILPMY